MTALPDAARRELARRAAMDSSLVAPTPILATAITQPPAVLEPPSGLINGALRLFGHRAALLAASERYRAGGGFPVMLGLHLFVADYASGAIDLGADLRQAYPEVSWMSLHRWRKRLDEGGPKALVDEREGNGPVSMIDARPEYRDLVVAMIQDRPHVGAPTVRKGLAARFCDDEPPSLRAVQRFVARWKRDHAVALAKLANPDDAKNRYQPAFGAASAEISRLNQLWELDSTPADVLCTDGRHAVIGVIDVYSRRPRVLVTPTSSASGICGLMRRAIIDWGVPETAHTDEGQDYVSWRFQRVLADLGIDHERGQPYTPEGKPHIERFFGTLTRDLFERLPGYAGHSVADAQAIRSRKSFSRRRGEDDAALMEVAISAEELQARCDAWIDHEYERRPHAALDGASPFEAAANWRGAVTRVENERALDLLLAEAPGDGRRRVGKKGISVDGVTYIAAELGPLVGETVLVRYDPRDMGRIYVFGGIDATDFICVAECPELTGIDRRDVAIAAKQRAREIDKQARVEARRLKARVKPHRIAAEIAAMAAREADAVVAFPGPAITHATPALDAAARAIAPATPEPVVHDLAALERGARHIAALEARAAARAREETSEERFARYRALEARAAAGETISDQDRRWMRFFRTTSEYDTGVLFEREFGPRAATIKRAEAAG